MFGSVLTSLNLTAMQLASGTVSNKLYNLFKSMSNPANLLDIALLTGMIYVILKLVRETRA